jgi:hypothetical protein
MQKAMDELPSATNKSQHPADWHDPLNIRANAR